VTTVTAVIAMAARPVGKVYCSQMLVVAESLVCGWLSVDGVAAWMAVWLSGVGVGVGVGIGVGGDAGVACIGVGIVDGDPLKLGCLVKVTIGSGLAVVDTFIWFIIDIQ
jgi:hypothetical protein